MYALIPGLNRSQALTLYACPGTLEGGGISDQEAVAAACISSTAGSSHSGSAGRSDRSSRSICSGSDRGLEDTSTSGFDDRGYCIPSRSDRSIHRSGRSGGISVAAQRRIATTETAAGCTANETGPVDRRRSHLYC